MVGIKNPNVAARSAKITNTAASHQARPGPCVLHAATRFIRTMSVSGIVVTKTQKRCPLSGDRSDAGAARHSFSSPSAPPR